MKKKYIVFGLIASSLYGFGQKTDSVYLKKKPSRTEIRMVYSHYLQNGNHSAVTGGVGTEKLQVYSPDLTLTHRIDSLHDYSINFGVDVISSASTDNIDFVISSASRYDNRGHLTLGFNKAFRKKALKLGAHTDFSLESDYTSFGFGVKASGVSSDKSSEWSASLDSYLDDLRWGRLNGLSRLRLVYPSELRNRNWLNEYLRRSYNLGFSWYQTINRKMALGIFPGLILQNGLLSTPFHRTFFDNDSVRVELLPRTRIKVPFGIQLNTFHGSRLVLKTYYRFYWDDWGLTAHTITAETVVKLKPLFSIAPSMRFHIQRGSSFFKRYKEHKPDARFYTSDYDLSGFYSLEPGIELRLVTLGNKPERRSVFSDELGLRYSYYRRSDGLYAQLLTLQVLLKLRSKLLNENRRE